MAVLTTMTFYAFRCKDGKIHVQNAVAGMLGQHHVYTPEEFEQWKSKLSKKELEQVKFNGENPEEFRWKCDCPEYLAFLKSQE